MFEVRSLLIVKKVLMKNKINDLAIQPAISSRRRFFHQALTGLLIVVTV